MFEGVVVRIDLAGIVVAVAGAAMLACGSSGGGAGDAATGTDQVADVAAVPDTGSDTVTPDPGVVDPGAVDPGAVDTASPDEGTTDPIATDPGVTDPGTTDPGATDPGVADEGVSDPGSQPPASHTDMQQGVAHKPGKDDPLKNCVSCHGADLHGDVGPSCYTCHNSSDHNVKHGGQMHGSDTTLANCKDCHGPRATASDPFSSTGGIGPACMNPACHGAD